MIKLYICCLVLFIGNLKVGQSVDIIKFVKYDIDLQKADVIHETN